MRACVRSSIMMFRVRSVWAFETTKSPGHTTRTVKEREGEREDTDVVVVLESPNGHSVWCMLLASFSDNSGGEYFSVGGKRGGDG